MRRYVDDTARWPSPQAQLTWQVECGPSAPLGHRLVSESTESWGGASFVASGGLLGCGPGKEEESESLADRMLLSDQRWTM